MRYAALIHKAFFFISWFTGIFWENLMSEGEQKKKKKTVLLIFLRNIPQCLCRRRNKKNNHNFKVLILLIYFHAESEIGNFNVGGHVNKLIKKKKA
jgi:hypothetical protein